MPRFWLIAGALSMLLALIIVAFILERYLARGRLSRAFK